jgi:hypothetical protein
MKSRIFTVILMVVATSGYAQVTNYNFSFEPNTTLGTWNYFDNGSNIAGVGFIANPFPSGINTSATVGKFTASADGGEWSGCESLYGTLGKWKFDPLNPTQVSIDVYKTSFDPVVIKFTSTNPAGQGTVYIGSAVPSAVNQWVTLTYIVSFASLGTTDNADNNAGTNQFVMHADRKTNRGVNRDIYFDNIRFTATKIADPISPPAPVAAPMVHAPTPPNRNTSDVVSIYSGRYTNLPGTLIGKNWGEATIASDILVDNDLTKKLLQFNYQGVVLASPINLLGFQKLHVDFYQTNQAQIKLSIINQGGGDVTKLLYISNPGWNSFDIPLSDFVGLNLATVYQLKLEGAPSQGNTTVFFDNLYFHKGTAIATSELNNLNLKLYPNPVKNVLDIEAEGYISSLTVFDILGQVVLSASPNASSANLSTTHLVNGTYIVKVVVDGKLGILKFLKE